MLEQREIVRKFNETYGPALVEAQALLLRTTSEQTAGDRRQKAKMSKSLGNGIYLSTMPIL